MNADFFVTDPKGECLPRVGWMLDEGGYDIRSFNTVDFSQSLHYNPIAYVEDEADVLEFVTCFIANTTGDKEHSDDPFWEKAERLLYVALIGYLVKHCGEKDCRASSPCSPLPRRKTTMRTTRARWTSSSRRLRPGTGRAPSTMARTTATTPGRAPRRRPNRAASE